MTNCKICQITPAVATFQQTRPRITPPVLVCNTCLNLALALRRTLRAHEHVHVPALLIWQLPACGGPTRGGGAEYSL